MDSRNGSSSWSCAGKQARFPRKNTPRNALAPNKCCEICCEARHSGLWQKRRERGRAVSARESGPAIRFEKIDKRYGGLYALRRVSLEIAQGECVVLAGRNGSGKTTLLRIASRLARPSAGTVTHGGSNSGSPQPALGFVAHATMVYDELTAEENLLLFGRLLGAPDVKRRVADLLGDIGLYARRDSMVSTFSRGLPQRAALALPR